MSILCVGSINIDLVYHVPHLVQPGETIAATSLTRGLGGKGVNQSVAAAKAGATVRHCGAVGYDGQDMVAEISASGIETGLINITKGQTGHAVIAVDADGENAIMIHDGANGTLDRALLDEAMAGLAPGDWVMLQNEVPVTAEAAELAREKGAHVAYSAAPFDPEAVKACLPHVTHLLLNEIENAALEALGIDMPPTLTRIVTQGAAGATWIAPGQNMHVAAFEVDKVVDTTGAGDCFAGNLVAALERGLSPIDAMYFAQAAAAIQITRPGAAPGDAGKGRDRGLPCESLNRLVLHAVPEALDPVKEAAFIGRVRLRAAFLKLPQKLLLARAEFHRGFDGKLYIHVADTGTAQRGHALLFQAQLLAGLRAFRHAHKRPATIDRGHFQLSAQGRGCH